MILKTVNPDGNMYDLLVNIIKNLTFYLTHRSELADIGYSDKELCDYKDKLLTVVQMYEDETIPQWFKDFPINTFLSSKFPYKIPYLDFMLSFENVVDVLFYDGMTFEYKDGIHKVEKMEVLCGSAVTIHHYNVEHPQIKYLGVLNKQEFKDNFLAKICTV